MGRRSTFLVLALLTAFAVGGCGEDNNDNEGPGATSTPAVTPAATATAVPTQTQVDGATPTPTQTPAGGETPMATPTPSGGACEADQLVLTITSAAGSDLDTGWTGISHNSVAVEQATVSTDLNDCADGECTVDGSALVGTRFGSPLPLSAGGVAVCVTNTFREAVTGTYNCATGCGESDVRLTSSVFLVSLIDHPCPLCVGDPTPNDGQKVGTCDDGPNEGAPCDVGGISPTFGPTSTDCPPSGSPVSDLPIDLTPLTTGVITTTAEVQCFNERASGGLPCYCEEQNKPNACDDLVCTVDANGDGLCQAGPIDAFCSNQKFRACRGGTGTTDCDDTFPGAGTCENSVRPCFGSAITREGQCGVESGTLVGIFCIPRVNAPAVNTTSGLPGPGALTLPVTTVRQPR